MDIIEIEIKNWDEYNPRADRANYSWFRFQNDFFHDQRLFGADPNTILVFQMLLCEASKKSSGCVDVSVIYLATMRQIPHTQIHQIIQELVNRGVILTAKSRQSAVKKTASRVRARPGDERTNETDERDERDERTLAPAAPVAVARNAIAFYCECYKSRYGHNPKIAPKQAGILSRIHRDHGPTGFENLIRGYFTMPNSFLVQRSHPVELIESKLNEITRFNETGKVVTRGHVKEFNEKLDDAMGPRAPTISEILADQKKLTGGQS